MRPVRKALRRARVCLSWLAFAFLMSTASGIGLGYLGAWEFDDLLTSFPARTWQPPITATPGEPASDDVELSPLPPVIGLSESEPASPPVRPGAAHAPHDIAADMWQPTDARAQIHAAWLATGSVGAEHGEVAAAAPPTGHEQYDEALELPRTGVEETLLHPNPDPALPGLVASPVIAIVIDDLGLNRRQTAAVADLPGPLTLAFIPYADDLDRQTESAHAQGHEIFLHLPMEPLDPGKDPGPNALLESLTPDELALRLRENLDRFSGYVGVNNHMGSRLTQDADAMAIVMAELKRRGLMFLDSMTIGGSVAHLTADEFGVPSAQRDIFLDNEPEVAAILIQLTALEAVADRRGYAIAIGHPYGATVTALAQWIPDALARGYRIVPVSQIIEGRGVIIAQHSTALAAPAAGP
jgi:polysaccharide deacetylase 2 family uncharacterized protein YibQ